MKSSCSIILTFLHRHSELCIYSTSSSASSIFNITDPRATVSTTLRLDFLQCAAIWEVLCLLLLFVSIRGILSSSSPTLDLPPRSTRHFSHSAAASSCCIARASLSKPAPTRRSLKEAAGPPMSDQIPPLPILELPPSSNPQTPDSRSENGDQPAKLTFADLQREQRRPSIQFNVHRSEALLQSESPRPNRPKAPRRLSSPPPPS